MVFLYTPFFCLSSPSFSVALSYCISYTCIVLYFFLSDFLLEQIYKFRFSCQLALYIQLLERFGVSIVTKNVFKTSSTSLLLCYIHVHSLIQGENKLVEFYPFRKFLSATVGVDNHKIFAAIVWWFKCTAKAGQ